MKITYTRPSLSSIANKVIKKCSLAEIKNVCYETEIPKLMKFISMEDAFSVTQIVQDQDSSFPYCHVLGHKLASIETAKNPENWKSVVARCPYGTCSNGCVHGAFQEKYRGDVLTGQTFNEAKKEFENICESSPTYNLTGLAQGSCYHALGHLLMYITGANINKSVATCDELGKKKDGRDFSGLCYDGAFMQIFQPLDTDDKSLIKNIVPEKENVYSFCSHFTGEKKNSCWTESWPMFLDTLKTGQGLLSFCSKLNSRGKTECISDLLYIMPIQFRFNYESIHKYCLTFTQPFQSQCFAMTASRILEIDSRNVKKTIDYCGTLDDENRKACFDKIVTDSSFDFDIKSPEFKELCSSLPMPWSGQCIQNDNAKK